MTKKKLGKKKMKKELKRERERNLMNVKRAN